ncbi:MAG: dNTP triphosphohydrolase, partial [Deltaproteobacteria bacterium]|nr:dNTP triphosphohydrolase [Deltaproteobacteria bacterium]
MSHARKDWEGAEESHLACYAIRSAESLGRHHPENAHPLRTCFSRDRDRILHSKCFRRLEYKTQVFVNGTADHYRTRLTHTMEMAAVGRTLARILKANEDLTESICLAHDIGHTPFGHAGEHALNALMKEQGGFDHNLQSLRCIEVVESPYPAFQGLNLSWEVRAGLLKHEAHVENVQLDGHPIGPFQSLEAQIADIADDMTYHAHDVDDGLEAGIVMPAQLEQTEFWHRATTATKERYSNLTEDQFLRATIRNLLELQMVDA